jgi:hypothetical protein
LKNLNEKESKNNKNEKDRKQWKEETDLSLLNQKPLVNSIINPVINFHKSSENPVTPRKGWDQPHDTVLNIWEKVEVVFLTKELNNIKLNYLFSLIVQLLL